MYLLKQIQNLYNLKQINFFIIYSFFIFAINKMPAFWKLVGTPFVVVFFLIAYKVMSNKTNSKNQKRSDFNLLIGSIGVHVYIVWLILYENVYICNLNTFFVETKLAYFSCLCVNVMIGCYNIIIFFRLEGKKTRINYSTHTLLSWLVTGLIFLFLLASDFILLFSIFEIVQILNYGFLATQKKKKDVIEAILKYYLFNFFSALFLFFFLLTVFFNFNTTNLVSFQQIVLSQESISVWLVISFLFLFTSFLVKVGGFPFSYYLPDIYEGGEKRGVLLLLLVNNFIYVIFYGKFFYIYREVIKGGEITNLLILVAFLTIIYSFVQMMYENSLYKFLAYSSISLVGYMLFGFAANSCLSYACMINLLLSYSVSFILLIIIITRANYVFNIKIDSLRNIRNIRNLDKVSYLCLLISLLSLGGVPPFAVFITKFSLWLEVYTQLGYKGLFLFSISSILTTLPYFRAIKFIFWKETRGGADHKKSNVMCSKVNILAYVQIACLFYISLYIFYNFIVLKFILLLTVSFL